MKRNLLVTIAALSLVLVVPQAQAKGTPAAAEIRTTFFDSVVEDTVLDHATLPLYRGSSGGRSVWFVVTESSDRADARRRGVNHAPKLAKARGTEAVQRVTRVDGEIVFPATVDFSPERVVVPGPTGFPPVQADPGSVGEFGYSPLIELPDGTVLNAPHVANDSGTHDKVIALDLAGRSITLQESEGFYEGKEVYYVSFDASHPAVAALEAVTYAPALNAAPGLGSNDRTTSARSGLIPFLNGQTGAANPERQGLNSALFGEGDPLNIVQSAPNSDRYSPLWDVYMARWSDAAVAAGNNVRQEDFDDVVKLAADGAITQPDGAPWGANGIIVNCPLISRE